MIRKLLHKIINRKVITCLLILVQIAWCVGLIYNTAVIFPLLNSFFYAVGIVVAIYIINRDGNPSYKIAWIIPILAAPLFGVLIYLLCANKKPSRYLRKRFEKTGELVTQNLKQDAYVIDNMPSRDSTRAYYLKNMGYPVCKDTELKYFLRPRENI